MTRGAGPTTQGWQEMLADGLVRGAGIRRAGVVARALSGAASMRVTAAYAVMLLAVSVTLTAMGPHARAAAVSQMSTNLHNLARGHLGTLVGSAFVNESEDIYFWLPGLVCLLALGELAWRGRGLLVTFAVGHIGATLIVAVGLVAAVETGSLPFSVARASDVGMSYGAVCVLGALTASIPARWRPVWLGWWLGIALIATAGADFTAFGHVLALLLGIGLSRRLRAISSWSPVHAALLIVGIAFGYLVLAGPWAMAPVAGLTGASVAQTLSWLVRRRSAGTTSSEELGASESVPPDYPARSSNSFAVPAGRRIGL